MFLPSSRAFPMHPWICAKEHWTLPVLCSIWPVRLGADVRLLNGALARLAKLVGAPRAPAAGVELHVRLGDSVDRGQPLLTVHSQTPGELEYALDFQSRCPELIAVDHA
jgi:hypothetical protein